MTWIGTWLIRLAATFLSLTAVYSAVVLAWNLAHGVLVIPWLGNLVAALTLLYALGVGAENRRERLAHDAEHQPGGWNAR